MSTSSGSLVRREGTMAMSSNPYARRAFFPRPISTSMAATLRSWADGTGGPSEATTTPAEPGHAGSRNLRRLTDFGGQVEPLHRDLGEQPVHPARIDDARAELLGGVGAAGHAVAQALGGFLPGVAGGDVAGE